MKNLTCLLFVITTFSLSCNFSEDSNCSNYIGYWEIFNHNNDGSEPLEEFTIVKEGENIIFESLDQGPYFGYDYKAVLTCDKKKLMMKGVPLVGDLELALIDDGETMIFAGNTYQNKKEKKFFFDSETLQQTRESSNDGYYLLKFKDGKLDYPIKCFDKKGALLWSTNHLIYRGSWRGDQTFLFINGHHENYYNSGEVRDKGYLDESNKLLKYEAFDKNGNSLPIGEFHNGSGYIWYYNNNGNISETAYYQDGKYVNSVKGKSTKPYSGH